jgi:hypothetical protein
LFREEDQTDPQSSLRSPQQLNQPQEKSELVISQIVNNPSKDLPKEIKWVRRVIDGE